MRRFAARQPQAIVTCLGCGTDPLRGTALRCAAPLHRPPGRGGAGALRESLEFGVDARVSGRLAARTRTRARHSHAAGARIRSSGTTQVGPQRAELAIRLAGVPGQGSNFPRPAEAARGRPADCPAQAVSAADAPVRPTLLLDDPAAELDEERLAGLIQESSRPNRAAGGDHPSRGIPGLRGARRHYVHWIRALQGRPRSSPCRP